MVMVITTHFIELEYFRTLNHFTYSILIQHDPWRNWNQILSNIKILRSTLTVMYDTSDLLDVFADSSDETKLSHTLQPRTGV